MIAELGVPAWKDPGQCPSPQFPRRALVDADIAEEFPTLNRDFVRRLRSQ
jgi:hypothetical protein